MCINCNTFIERYVTKTTNNNSDDNDDDNNNNNNNNSNNNPYRAYQMQVFMRIKYISWFLIQSSNFTFCII
jgi:hypothetical protein